MSKSIEALPTKIAILTLDSLYSNYALKNLISLLKTRVKLLICSERINNKKYGSYSEQAKKVIKKSGFSFFIYLNLYVFIYRFVIYVAAAYQWIFRKKRKLYPLKWLSKRYHFETVTTPDINHPKVLKLLRENKIDLVLSIHLDQLVSRNLLDIPKYGGINLHYGRLPDNAGPFPSIWSVLRKEPKAYITIHYMNEMFDKGEILATASLDTEGHSSILDLDCCLMKLGAKKINEVILKIEKLEKINQPQDMTKFRYRSYPSPKHLGLLKRRKFKLFKWKDFFKYFL